tara:strand:+ start:1573 stop:1887 length:315 start_codon:yes stop_codon:yes gene_type:complete
MSAPIPSTIRFHPKLSEIYQAKVERLAETLADSESQYEANELLRGLIDKVSVAMTEDGPEVRLQGDIARMIFFADPKTEQKQCSKKMVAEERFLLYRTVKNPAK